MKKAIASLLTIFATFYYVIVTVAHTNFSSGTLVAAFFIFIFPYVCRCLLTGYLVIHSLFRKAKDIDDSNSAALISLLGTNLSVFVGIFINLNSKNPDSTLLYWGSVLSLLIFPFFFVGLMTLGYNLTVLPEANTLNTKGIYSISRHPLYLCYIIWFVLQNLICQTWIMALVSVVQIILTVLRAKYEEKLLEKNFPEYKDYKETVWWIGRKQKDNSSYEKIQMTKF